MNTLSINNHTHSNCSVIGGVELRPRQWFINFTPIPQLGGSEAVKAGPSGLGRAAAVIQRDRTQGLHPALASLNPRSSFVNSQLVCLLPVGIFNYVSFI